MCTGWWNCCWIFACCCLPRFSLTKCCILYALFFSYFFRFFSYSRAEFVPSVSSVNVRHTIFPTVWMQFIWAIIELFFSFCGYYKMSVIYSIEKRLVWNGEKRERERERKRKLHKKLLSNVHFFFFHLTITTAEEEEEEKLNGRNKHRLQKRL